MSSELDVLNELRPYLVIESRKYSTDLGTQQDLAQEGWIAAWKVLRDDRYQDHPNKMGLARKSARWRMLDVLNTGVSEGSPSMQGKAVVRNATPVDPNPDDKENVLDAVQTIQEGLEEAYHKGEIREALASLTARQKDYVFKRFWMDMSTEQLRKEGYSYSLWYGGHPERSVRNALSQRLEHLKDYI